MILVNTKSENEFETVIKLIKSGQEPVGNPWSTYKEKTVVFIRNIVTQPSWSFLTIEYAAEEYPDELILSFTEFIEDYYPNEVTTPEPISDQVYKPIHYQLLDGTQVKDHITSLTAHMLGVRAWATGNVIKYLARAGRKDDMVKDLKKAQENIQIIIDDIEKENN